MTPERLQEIEDYVATVEYATMNQALGLITEIRRLTAERDEAVKDVAFHAECRPNRQRAEAAMADAKATHDRWADEVVRREAAEATIATLRAELQAAQAALQNVRLAAASALSYGHQATTIPHDMMVARKEQLLRGILRFCEQAGVTGSPLREQPHPTPAQEGQ